MSPSTDVDIAVIGGGVAGLWILNRLCRMGYDAVLFERSALGCGQTLASQGIIHGGGRYLINDAAGKHGSMMRDMPSQWRACFAGKGDLDLKGVKRLSGTQHLWYPTMSLDGATRFCERATSSGVPVTKLLNVPAVLRKLGLNHGKLYRLREDVIDMSSLLEQLAKPWPERIYQAEFVSANADSCHMNSIHLQTAMGLISLRAHYFIFAAGSGNEQVAKILGLLNGTTQRRPLRQIMVRPCGDALYMHCISNDPRPLLTITTHRSEGQYVWYIGGLVAARAAALTEREAIVLAMNELKGLFPNLELRNYEWSTYPVDRAEAYASGLLPYGPVLRMWNNVAIAWPTKMTLVPMLGAQVVAWIVQQRLVRNIQPIDLQLQHPVVGCPPWAQASWEQIRPEVMLSSSPDKMETED